MGIVIGIVIVLAIAAFFAVLTCKGKHSDLFKWLLIAIFVTFCLTWIIPYGYFSNATFAEYGMNRLGLIDIPTTLYYGAYFGLSTLIYLFILGGFYGVLSKTKSYQVLVKNIAKHLKGKELLFMVITSSLLIVLSSFVKNTFAILVFVPFLITILLNMKVDKLTTFAVTFGSILAGVVGCTYGSDGLYFINHYMGTTVNTGLSYRAILAAIALVGYEALLVLRITKTKKKKSNEDSSLEADPYPVEDVKGKISTWPIIVIFTVLLVFVILGYVAWDTNFNILVFNKFHNWLTGLTIGKDFTLFKYILGTSATGLGNFEITSLVVIILIISVIVAFIEKVSFNDYLKNFGEGAKKMLKPVCLYVLVYTVFVAAYMSPFIPTVTNWAYGLTEKFNPFIATAVAFVTSIFHADLGYTGYVVGQFLTTSYAENISLIHTLYVSTYGIVQVLLPVSGLLMVGLSYLKIEYKSWFKYIWMFAVLMLVALLILTTIVYY